MALDAGFGPRALNHSQSGPRELASVWRSWQIGGPSSNVAAVLVVCCVRSCTCFPRLTSNFWFVKRISLYHFQQPLISLAADKPR